MFTNYCYLKHLNWIKNTKHIGVYLMDFYVNAIDIRDPKNETSWHRHETFIKD